MAIAATHRDDAAHRGSHRRKRTSSTHAHDRASERLSYGTNKTQTNSNVLVRPFVRPFVQTSQPGLVSLYIVVFLCERVCYLNTSSTSFLCIHLFFFKYFRNAKRNAPEKHARSLMRSIYLSAFSDADNTPSTTTHTVHHIDDHVQCARRSRIMLIFSVRYCFRK